MNMFIACLIGLVLGMVGQCVYHYFSDHPTQKGSLVALIITIIIVEIIVLSF